VTDWLAEREGKSALVVDVLNNLKLAEPRVKREQAGVRAFERGVGHTRLDIGASAAAFSR
jgi:hypothetical protein